MNLIHLSHKNCKPSLDIQHTHPSKYNYHQTFSLTVKAFQSQKRLQRSPKTNAHLSDEESGAREREATCPESLAQRWHCKGIPSSPIRQASAAAEPPLTGQ